MNISEAINNLEVYADVLNIKYIQEQLLWAAAHPKTIQLNHLLDVICNIFDVSGRILDDTPYLHLSSKGREAWEAVRLIEYAIYDTQEARSR